MKKLPTHINLLKTSSSTPTTSLKSFKSGDVLVLFGELFQKGYANGLVDAAQKRGMKIVYSTVGRRTEQHNLRSLNENEVSTIPTPFINIPLECGFDLEPSNSNSATPVDLCKAIGLKEGIHAQIDLTRISESQKNGELRFRQQVRLWVQELEKHISPGKQVLVAHLMAGGVPRSKIILSLMNRIFKGTGDRYLGSEDFWNSHLGQFCQQSFLEVTAHSFKILIDETTALRNRQATSGGMIHYSAYGYHGTPIYFNRELQWLCYTPYLQGFAKKQLEEYSLQAWNKAISSCVYNCPEILTNSSGIFPGVEIFLYLLYFELKARNIKHPMVQSTLSKAEALVKPDGLTQIHSLISQFLIHPELQNTLDFQAWPKHSTKSLMELMLKTSEDIIALHLNEQNLMTIPLSELIIHASGELILNDIAQPQHSVSWIGHDAIIDFFEHDSASVT